jgi:hypothetical protein
MVKDTAKKISVSRIGKRTGRRDAEPAQALGASQRELLNRVEVIVVSDVLRMFE